MKKKNSNLIALMCLILLPFGLFAQQASVTVSGNIKDQISKEGLPYVNVVLKIPANASLVTGTISNEKGLFTLSNVKPGEYQLEASFIGYKKYSTTLYVGANSEYLNIGTILLEPAIEALNEVVVTAQQDAVTATMDKKTFAIDDNVSQSGGSVLQSMNNLPGITTQDGQIQLRGNDQVMVLINGKQTAITGFGKQNGLDNLPASAVEKIEIINNPSAKYDANGNAGIINIILKKQNQEGLNGKLGLSTGLGALWVRKEILPGIRPQYQATPKVNPSVALNYRKKKVNLFLQADNLYTQTLNKNEFITRTYDDGTVINQQMKRNRDTNFFTSTAGMDWTIDENNSLTISGFISQETIKDYGDQPFLNGNTGESLRL